MINNKQKSTPQKVEANPIISLFQNHINKDIDQNFVDALEALLFLTNADSGTFQQTFPYRLPPDFFNNIDETKNKDMDDFLNHLKNKNSHKKSTSKSWIDEDGNDIVNLNKYWLGHEDHDDEFHSAIHQQLTNKSKSEKQPTHVNYTPVDMLVYKLLENLRRLYSAEKAQERKLSLEEQ